MLWRNDYCERQDLRKCLTAYRRPLRVSGCPICGSLPRVYAELDPHHGELKSYVQCPSCGMTTGIKLRQGWQDVSPFNGGEASPIRAALDSWEENNEWREAFVPTGDGFYKRMSDGVRFDADGVQDRNQGQYAKGI